MSKIYWNNEITALQTNVPQFDFVPVKGKAPIGKDWYNHDYKTQITKMLDRGDATGLGAKLGKEYGIVAADCDGQPACDLYKSWGFPETFCSTSRAGNEAYFFLVPEEYRELIKHDVIDTGKTYTKPGGKVVKSQIELRWGGKQQVLPPSIHPDTNERYQWIIAPNGTNLAIAPDELIEEMMPKIEQKTEQFHTPQIPVYRSPSDTRIPLDKVISKAHRESLFGLNEGGRDNEAAALIRDLLGAYNWLVTNGYTPLDDPYALLQIYCSRCSPPLSNGDCERLYKSGQKSNPEPCLSEDKLQSCVNVFLGLMPDGTEKRVYSAKSMNKSVATALIPADILNVAIESVDEDDKEIRHVTDNEVEEFQELAALKGTKFDPRKFLPKELAEAFIADAAKQNIDPVSFMAYLLPCVSSLMGKVTLDLGGGFKVPNIIWSMLVQRSGGGKTRAADIFTAQLLEWEGESRAKYQDDLKVYKKQVRQQTKDDEEIPLPKNRKFLFGVATPQAVVRRFADQEDNGCIWVRDEIKGLFGGLSQFTKGEGEGVEIVLETWGGNALPVDRVNNDTDSFFVSTSRMSMCGGIQPAIVPKVFDPKDPQGVGARMLPVLPSDSYSKRNKENIKLPSLLSKLYFDVKESARIDNETNRTNDWDGITLSDEADDYFTPVYEYFANLRSNNSAVDAWQSKANNHIGRVAFVLHAIHCVYDKSLDRKRISKDILEKAHNYILIIRDWVKQMSGEMVSETSPTMPAILNKIVSYAERVNKPLAMSDIYRNVYGIKQLAKQEKVGDTEFTYSLCKELVALGKGVFSTSIKNKPLFNAIATCSEDTSTEIAIKIDPNTDSNRDTENHCSKSNDSTEINHEENTIEDIDTSKAEIIMRGNDTHPNIVINPPMEDRNDARIAQDSIPETVLVDLCDNGSTLQVAINVLCPNEKSDIDHTIQVGSKVVCPTSTDGDPWSGAIAEVLEITNDRAKLFNSDFAIPAYKDLSVLTLVNEVQSNG